MFLDWEPLLRFLELLCRSFLTDFVFDLILLTELPERIFGVWCLELLLGDLILRLVLFLSLMFVSLNV